MPEFHRNDHAIIDQGGTQSGAETQEKQLTSLVTAQGLHRGVVHHFDRTPEGCLVIKSNPAGRKIVRLNRHFAAKNDTRVPHRNHVVSPIGGHLLDPATIFWTVISGPEANRRGSAAPVTSILTFVPPTSTTSTFTRCLRLMRCLRRILDAAVRVRAPRFPNSRCQVYSTPQRIGQDCELLIILPRPLPLSITTNAGHPARLPSMFEWLVRLPQTNPVAHGIGLIALVLHSGMALGSIRVKGIGLGSAGVLFMGILAAHFSQPVEDHMLNFVKEFGLVLFVFTIGLQLGPGFFALLRAEGLKTQSARRRSVWIAAGLSAVLGWLLGLDLAAVAGLFAGASTNTPALGAAQQALATLEGVSGERRAFRRSRALFRTRPR